MQLHAGKLVSLFWTRSRDDDDDDDDDEEEEEEKDWEECDWMINIELTGSMWAEVGSGLDKTSVCN